jgi:hypothetical protein
MPNGETKDRMDALQEAETCQTVSLYQPGFRRDLQSLARGKFQPDVSALLSKQIVD